MGSVMKYNKKEYLPLVFSLSSQQLTWGKPDQRAYASPQSLCRLTIQLPPAELWSLAKVGRCFFK